jgi:hypothetical protein
VNLTELLRRVIANRTETLPSEKQVSISFDFANEMDSVVCASAANLEATFANVIDNAVEAIDTDGKVRVKLRSENGFHKITVSDNGCGIPEHILPQLMKERATFGKNDGNGLGLFHAKTTVEGLGGNIQITSTVGQKTEVTIALPVQNSGSIKSEQGFEIDLSSVEQLVILDDDQSIHSAVMLLLGHAPSVEVVHLYSIPEFESWMTENGSGEFNSRIYWMDYDLKHPSENGLTMIQKHSLQFEVYLVTGMAGSEEVQKIARAQNIRLFAKDEISKVQFKFNETFRLPEIGLG